MKNSPPRLRTNRLPADSIDDEEIAKIIRMHVNGFGYHEIARELGNMRHHTPRKIVSEHQWEVRELIRERVSKLLEKFPFYGPATVARELHLDSRILMKHCSDLFSYPSKRLPPKFKKWTIEFCRSKNHQIDRDSVASYQIILWLILGLAELDIAEKLGVSHQLVYQVRDEAIKAGFTFL